MGVGGSAHALVALRTVGGADRKPLISMD